MADGTTLEQDGKSVGWYTSSKEDLETPLDVKTAAGFLGVSPSLVYAWIERKAISHFRIMGRTIRFSIPELAKWRQQFHVNGGIDEQ
jgi:excisionase family DNA binding protein